jgi:lysine 2,3-aminomutase
MGYLPGYATPRIVCDVPFVGKRWVHMDQVLDEELPHALGRQYPYYDPIDTLPQTGQDWWPKESRSLAATAQ